MNYLIQKTFENRGYTNEFLRDFDDDSHPLLKDIDVLVGKLREIRMSGEHITIYPDFDMDGISAGTVNFAGLSELGFNVSLFIPDPSEGYGIKKDAIDRIMQQYPDTKYIITCDTGISETEAIAYCNSLDIHVLLTDHHKQQEIAPADVIVDPMRMDETYPHPYICGAYVAYQVLIRYAEIYENLFMQEQIKRLRVFAGIGTISDSMTLWYENRQLVRDSVLISKLIYGSGSPDIVNNITGCDVYRRAFYGLYVMFCAFADAGRLNSMDGISEEFYGFYVAPAFNSVKRMNGDMTRAFGVFFGNNQRSDITYLIDLNRQRREAVDKAYDEMMARPQPFLPYCYFSDANGGILGLLAQKLLLINGSPVMVVKQDGTAFKGSGRSPEWYPFLKYTEKAGAYAAGHDAAFGIGFGSKVEIKQLCHFLSLDVPKKFAKADVTEVPYDFVIDTSGKGDVGVDILLFMEYLQELENYRPFGSGFESPRILLKFTKDASKWEAMGKLKEHLKIHLPNAFDVVCFNQGHLLHLPDTVENFMAEGHLDVNRFRDKVTVQFMGTVLVES